MPGSAAAQIPEDTVAVVENRSAVGEQYLDFQPRTEGERLADGDVIPRKDTRYPLRVDTLLLDFDRTIESVDKRDLATVVDELGTAFADGGADLQRLLDSGDALTRAATGGLPETVRLIDDGRIVLDAARDLEEIKTFSTNFANLADTLKASTPTCGSCSTGAPWPPRRLDLLIRENQGSLSALLANLITISRSPRPASTASSSCSSRTPTSSPAATPSSPVTDRPLRARPLGGAEGLQAGLRGYEADRPQPDHEPPTGQHRRPVHPAARLGEHGARGPERPRPLAVRLLQLIRSRWRSAGSPAARAPPRRWAWQHPTSRCPSRRR